MGQKGEIGYINYKGLKLQSLLKCTEMFTHSNASHLIHWNMDYL